MRLLAYLLSLNIFLLSAVAVEPTSSEIQVMDNWIRASFYGEELELSMAVISKLNWNMALY